MPDPLELTSVAALRAWRAAQRAAGRRVGFVPTMGYLHEGHLSLVDAARARTDTVLLSIFVNPLQFGPAEDLARYPRDLPRDRALAAGRGVDALFLPAVEEMYRGGSPVRVTPGPLGDRWEGAVRPGHFTGVCTVVAKLFNLVQPDVACFGQKDIQQATILREMVRALDFPLEFVLVPTAREPDGLARSSRNVYLAPPERAQAVGLARALAAACAGFRAGERDPARLLRCMHDTLAQYPGVVADYIALLEPGGLDEATVLAPDTIAAIAARVGPTRLIDNAFLGQGLS